MDGYIGALVGRFPGGYAEFEYLIVLRLVCRVLEVKPLMRQVPEVFILRIVGFPVYFKGNVVRLGVVNLLVAALYVSYAPGRDNEHFGCESFD